MAHNVLIDVQEIEFGIISRKLVYVLQVNLGMGLCVLAVQMEKHGI